MICGKDWSLLAISNLHMRQSCDAAAKKTKVILEWDPEIMVHNCPTILGQATFEILCPDVGTERDPNKLD